MSLPNSIKTIEDTEINNITNISIEPTNDIDNNVQLCITNLKILGCIKPKDKLYYIENNFHIFPQNKKDIPPYNQTPSY